MITKNLATLKIHKLSQEQYDRELSAGHIDTDALYLTPDNRSEITVADILQNVYPVGAIYLSANNISPASLFGGTWEQIQDRFLLGAGSAYTAGSIGGESTHTLTVQEMPVHSHTVNAHSHAIGLDNDTTVGTYGWSLHINSNGTSVTGAHKTVTSGTSSPNTNTIGGGVAHNNMPPYLTVYMWKRIE